jgi:starvation-inducible DNA-binding protein
MRRPPDDHELQPLFLRGLVPPAAGCKIAARLQRKFMPANTTLVKEVSQENSGSHPVVQHLQREVANAFVLYANYKHYHWQTFGPLFRDLHLMFDEFAEHTIGTIDEMAERIRMIGQDLQSVQLKQFQQAASIQSSQAGQSIREMLEEADANLLIVIRDMRVAAKTADDSNDPGTVDLFSKLVQIHEKDEWFLREVLKKKDGLVS